MFNQQTMSILHSLKLSGMARSLEERLADPQQAALSHDDFVGLLVCLLYTSDAAERRG